MAADVEAVLQGGGDRGEGAGAVVDAPAVVGGGDAVLGDDQRDVADDGGGVTPSVADGLGVVLPAREVRSASSGVGIGPSTPILVRMEDRTPIQSSSRAASMKTSSRGLP